MHPLSCVTQGSGKRLNVPTSVFCVFEGGGAKGVAHLSTLRALDTLAAPYDLQIRGYAGTSAGAIIAALAAAGWDADELLDHSVSPMRSPALEAIGRGDARSLLDLFDPPSRRRLRWLTALVGLLSSKSRRRIPGLLSASILAALLGLWPHATLLLLIPVGIAMWWLLARFRGWLSLASIEALLEQLLRVKLNLPPDAPPVTFARLHQLRGVELAIIAANLDTVKLVRFDRKRSPDVSVARAVTASAAIPLVFLPVEVEGSPCCDGGIVSNLPAWVFDARLSIDPSALVVTSENSAASQPGATRAPLGGVRLMLKVLRAALFGTRVLETRALRNHLELRLDTDAIPTLDFGQTTSHLALLPEIDRPARLIIERHLLEMAAVDARFDLYVGELGAALGPAAAASLVSIVMMKSDGGGGFTPWRQSGKRDCRWQPYAEMIEKAIEERRSFRMAAPVPTDSDWCVVLYRNPGTTVAIVCLGVDEAEQLTDIAHFIEQAELDTRPMRHNS